MRYEYILGGRWASAPPANRSVVYIAVVGNLLPPPLTYPTILSQRGKGIEAKLCTHIPKYVAAVVKKFGVDVI